MESLDSLPVIEFTDFLKVGIAVGTIVNAELNSKAIKPAYKLIIDFGSLGIKESSAQITENYTIQTLIGKQVVAVINFPPKRIAGVRSEVLVLAAVTVDHGAVLLQPTQNVNNGIRIL